MGKREDDTKKSFRRKIATGHPSNGRRHKRWTSSIGNYDKWKYLKRRRVQEIKLNIFYEEKVNERQRDLLSVYLLVGISRLIQSLGSQHNGL